jgi:hypothetical protein
MAADPTVDLTTLTEVLAHLDQPSDAGVEDAKLEKIITRASKRISTFCDRRFITETYTEYQHGRRSNSILLKQFPAVKPTELNIDPEGVFGSETVVDTSDYEIMDDSLVVLKNGLRFQTGVRNIKVVYEAGYGTAALGTIPFDLEDGCIQLVDFMYGLVGDRRIGQLQKSKQGENVTYVQGMPDFVIEAILPYKRYEFATSNAPVGNS